MELSPPARQELKEFLQKWSPDVDGLVKELKALVPPVAWANAIQDDCEEYLGRLRDETKRELLLNWAEELGYQVR